MNILLTLAGHSRRFKAAGYQEPKFMINVGDRPMIEHVVDMFSDSDKFYFVVNSSQVTEDPGLVDYLTNLVPAGSVTVIDPHEHGPVFSALQVQNLPDDEPLVVTYCDFYVLWNYEEFKASVAGYDAAIPYFIGFHPASFGDTKFAYMKLDSNGLLLELREKESFTNERHNEPASVGIYYFKDFNFFKRYSRQLLNSGENELPEAYVSLLSNLIVADGGAIIASPVKYFICLGTPKDVDQYNYWYSFHSTADKYSLSGENSRDYEPNSLNLIPMAGKGSRFKDAMYKTSKPLIGIFGDTMIARATRSMPPASKWVYVCLDKDLKLHSLEKKLQALQPNGKTISLAETTNGQAVTCLAAKEEMHLGAPIFISSCDYEVRYDTTAWKDMRADASTDIIVWTIKLGGNLTKNPDSFAYCRMLGDTNQIAAIIEKKAISDQPGEDHLVVGSFWFRNSEDFIEIAEAAIEYNDNVNGEIYIGNSLNRAILSGKKVKAFEISHWISYGDPWELDLYYYWINFFNDRYSREN